MFELGNSLREARSRQGLGYPQVELATKIRAKYVRALEEEQFDVLPAETYVRGFLRTYADFLGLDGQLYVDEYESRFVTEGYDGMPAERRAKSRTKQRQRQRELSFQRRAVILALVGMAALVALVIVAWRFGGASPSAPSVLPPASAKPAGLSFSGPGTYIQVRRDSSTGSVLYEGTLQQGETNLVLGNRFWILLRHPKRLHLTLNGKAVSLPSRKTLRVIVTPTSTAVAG
jgi:cytoskeletal protein RodZ